MNLTKKQKLHLKGLAHSLKPVVQLGQHGLTEGVIAEIDNSLNIHELIKVKVATDDRDTKRLIIDAIVRDTKAIEITTIGHTLIIFRQTEDKKILLPKK